MPAKSKPPVERKVHAAAGGAGLGVALAEAITWAIDTYVHTPDQSGDLPVPITGLIVAGVAAGLAWLAGYHTKHPSRPDPSDA